jgi:hypothetical protein
VTRFKGITPSRGNPPEPDTSMAHPARVCDYRPGGKDNYPADNYGAIGRRP